MNWLIAGISSSPNLLTETFFFDKSENEFFSILWSDYVLLEKHEGVTISYSMETKRIITDKLQRLEEYDPQIIRIPSLSREERRDLFERYLESLNDSSLASELRDRNWSLDFNRFELRLELDASDELVKLWNDFKYPTIRNRAETFVNLNGINLESVGIIEFEEEGNITFDLTVDDKPAIRSEKRRWWQFWK